MHNNKCYVNNPLGTDNLTLEGGERTSHEPKNIFFRRNFLFTLTIGIFSSNCTYILSWKLHGPINCYFSFYFTCHIKFGDRIRKAHPSTHILKVKRTLPWLWKIQAGWPLGLWSGGGWPFAICQIRLCMYVMLTMSQCHESPALKCSLCFMY
jgi:hypothetical protein